MGLKFRFNVPLSLGLCDMREVIATLGHIYPAMFRQSISGEGDGFFNLLPNSILVDASIN